MGALAGCGGDDGGPAKTAKVTPAKPVAPPPSPTSPNNPSDQGYRAAYDLYGMGAPNGSATPLADAAFEVNGGAIGFTGPAPSVGTFSITATDGYSVASNTQDPRIQSTTPGVVMSADAGGRVVAVCSPDSQGFKNTLPAYVGVLTWNRQWSDYLDPTSLAVRTTAGAALGIIDKHQNEGVEVVGCAGPSALAWSKPGAIGTVVDPYGMDPTNWPVRVVLSSANGVANTTPRQYHDGSVSIDAPGTPWLSGGDLALALNGETVKAPTGAPVTARAYRLDTSLYVFLTRGDGGPNNAPTTYVLRYPAS